MGIALRAACYLISYIMIYVVAIMIPGAKNSLSALGQKTMAIYLFHGLIFAVFRRGEIWYQSLGCYFGGGIHRNHLASLPTAIRSIYGLGNAYPDAAAAKNR